MLANQDITYFSKDGRSFFKKEIVMNNVFFTTYYNYSIYLIEIVIIDVGI